MFKKWFGKKGEDAPNDAPAAGGGHDTTAEVDAPATAEAATPSMGKESEPSAATTPAAETSDKPKSRWARFTAGLAKTKKNLSTLFSLRRALDDDYLDELEAQLYTADFGPMVVDALMNGEDGVRAAWKRKEIAEAEHVRDYLKKQLREMLTQRDHLLREADSGTTVILVSGVNGAGKTTSIAKLASRFHADGKKVVLAAADTFRAAAVEQLTIWSERIGVEIVCGDPNADPASVAYRGVERAVEVGADYLIVDTAGRLHTQKNLMRELAKISGVLGKKCDDAPHEALLVVDATTGQNALNQARQFGQEVPISGIVLAKLDGTAKGGIVVAINNELEIPVKFVGLGETLDAFAAFDPEKFVDDLFAQDDE